MITTERITAEVTLNAFVWKMLGYDLVKQSAILSGFLMVFLSFARKIMEYYRSAGVRGGAVG